VAVSLQMQETATGKVVWASSAAKGGVTLPIRLFGGGGPPLNELTEQCIDALINKLFD
jgi:polysaccharide biosynthesis protein PelC